MNSAHFYTFQGVGCDVQLTAKDQADIVAFSNMIQEKLYPTLVTFT